MKSRRIMLRATAVAVIAVVCLSYGFADTGWVVNRGENTVAAFNSTSREELTGSPVTVGLQPVDLAAATTSSSTKIYVANYAGNSISVVDQSTMKVVATHTASTVYGTFSQPTAIAYAYAPTAGLAQVIAVDPVIAVVDRKELADVGGTLRFIDPATESVVDEWEIGIAGFDPTGVACAPTNGHFWITGKGTDEVIRVAFSAGPPFSVSPPPSMTQISHASIVDPVKVVITDDDDADGAPDYIAVINGGSNTVTFLDGDGVVRGTVDVGVPQIDAILIDDKVYVATTANEIKIIPVASPFAVSDTITGFGGNIGRLGKTSNNILHVGSGDSVNNLHQVDLTTTPATITTFTFGDNQPYAFAFATASTTVTLADEPTGSGNGVCAIALLDRVERSNILPLAGLAFLLLLGYTALRRRMTGTEF